MFLATWGVGTAAVALEPDRRISQYNHQAWRSENGLPQISVIAIAQTPDGYLWFGTHEGLVRFDGTRLTVFDRKGSPAMHSQLIQALVVDASGVLWVGTDQGILRYEQGQLRGVPEAGTLESQPIYGLVADGTSVWISSPVGVTRAPVSGEAPWRNYTARDGLPGSRAWAIIGDGAGGLWGGSSQGLVRVRGDSVELTPLPGPDAPQVSSLWLARDGTLWIGTTRGLLSLHLGRFTAYGAEQGIPRMAVTRLLEDRDGNLWVGTENGLLRRGARGFAAATAPQSLANELIQTLLEAGDGSLWVGTPRDGVHRLSSGPFLPVGVPEGSTFQSLNSVLETQDGTLWWGGSRGGLERMKGGVITRIGAAQGLEDQRIRSLAESPDGALWVGTYSGPYRFDGQRFLLLGPEQGMPPGATVWAMVPEPDGGMWFATSEGLVSLRGGRATVFGPEQGFTVELIMPMVREDSGTIWYGTHSGVVRFAHGTFTRFTVHDGLAGNSVFSLHLDAYGSLWVGTLTGVSRLKNGRFTSITAAQGLPDDTAYSILPDSKDHLWMSNNKGVSRVSRRELEEVLDGRRERVHGLLFDDRDGMRASECNGGGQPSGWRARDGRLWFATLHGVAGVKPEDARLQLPPPRPHIEELRVQGQPVPFSERLELAPGQQGLDIRFTAFVPHGAERVPFRYRLEGYDSGWVDAEERRKVSYPRLPPGSYRFEVTARGRDGRWVEPGAAVEVTLRTWFHQTRWFYALCALALGGVVASGYAWRVGRLKTRERWLKARVEERTRELDANLRELRATQAQLVQAGKMAAVGTLAAGVGHEINNPLSYIMSNLDHACEELAELARREEGLQETRERLNELLQVLREALMGADRVRRIVKDLKTFSRQDEDTRGPVDLRAVMDSAAKMAAGELRPRAQLIREYAADVPPAEGNEARLSQVFLNLIINAAHALPEGKPEQNEVRLVLRRAGQGQVVAEVRDTGSGIPPEVLGRIFDPFFTTKPVGVGTGLGLALCHAFITSMGGRIEVESQVGQGTLFRVILPAASSAVVAAPQAVQARAGDGVRGRVLVVDDDPLVSSALRRTLSREHEVEGVVSARRALELLTSPQGGYDVILCDLMMPEMTGMDLHAQLQETAPEQARRMVFITGGAYTPAAKEFLERVSNARLEKPFDSDKLRDQVREWVKQARAPGSGHAA
ncbi:two-component regulator propeller domain-containing protein [Hyalangium sp.]|uniref:two-component regulator propeller domain-containing protein n=1 Tax=Hyalangium sp. TaxID=2028555 RepID=UPI002D6F8909|nr:two-component regulator propeller domain-containing protein [Hyalangium sp.]HYH97362.1 two-component regulator propeller domain-containing protein [Hyalangium sp.]